MSITGIGSYQIAANSLYTGQTQSAAAVESDGDADRSRVSAPTNATGKSDLFTSAISQTLFQIGVTPAAANVATGAAPTNPQNQALNSFVQNLFGALQPAANGKASTVGKTTTSVKKTDDDNSDSGDDDDANTIGATNQVIVPPTSGHPSQGTAISSHLENRLQGLMQQVASESASTASNSSDPALPALQQSYQGLLASQGGGGKQPSLASFLQALAHNLQDAPPTGNVISTQA